MGKLNVVRPGHSLKVVLLIAYCRALLTNPVLPTVVEPLPACLGSAVCYTENDKNEVCSMGCARPLTRRVPPPSPVAVHLAPPKYGHVASRLLYMNTLVAASNDSSIIFCKLQFFPPPYAV